MRGHRQEFLARTVGNSGEGGNPGLIPEGPKVSSCVAGRVFVAKSRQNNGQKPTKKGQKAIIAS